MISIQGGGQDREIIDYTCIITKYLGRVHNRDPNMQILKRSADICSTQALDAINSLDKVLASTVFCLLIYQMMGALFYKMINPVRPQRVTVLAAREAFM